MIKVPAITCLFVDIGGVLLTNGWDRHARERAAAAFKLGLGEMEERHHLNFDTYEQGKVTLKEYLDRDDTYEQGKVTLKEYLDRVVFHKQRTFTRAQFQRCMFEQSEPFLDMIGLVGKLRVQHALKVAVVSNEGRELNAYRIRKFKLTRIVDFFICSSLVHLRKPDADIFRLALDIAQTPVERIVYLENTPMFVQVAEGLGIRSILHKDYESTRLKLASFGLCTNHGAIDGAK